jgi:hypothetical protein
MEIRSNQNFTSPPLQESYVEKMAKVEKTEFEPKKEEKSLIDFENFFKTDFKASPPLPPLLRKSTLSSSLKRTKLILSPAYNAILAPTNEPENFNLDFQKSFTLRNGKRRNNTPSSSADCPKPSIIPRSSSTSSMGSLGSNPRSITPIASPVNHHDLALCADLDIDPLTLENEGALKRGIDLRGIALCKYQGIQLHELKKYDAVKVDIDITGISICKANGIGIELLANMGVIEPKIDISGIAICKTQGIDIFELQDYGLLEPSRSLRTVAMLNQQGYEMEEISNMEFHVFDSVH